MEGYIVYMSVLGILAVGLVAVCVIQELRK